MDKAYIILNPTAGGAKTPELEEKIVALFEREGMRCDLGITQSAGDGAEMAHAAGTSGYDPIVVAGGDGTVNEVVNGIVGTKSNLGILPIGTVNVLARELGIPLKPKRAVRNIASGNVRTIDVGRANGRYFTLMAGFGFDAEVVGNVLKPMKDIIGSSAYVLKGLETLAKYKATDVSLEMPEGTYETRAFLIIVANVSTYTYNLKIAPHAHPDDGLLDVCIFERPVSDKIGFLRQIIDVVRRRHIYHKSVKYFKTSSVRIASDPEIMVQLDGDAYGTTGVDISIVPRILPVITPRKPVS